jgi:hypothetical protein
MLRQAGGTRGAVAPAHLQPGDTPRRLRRRALRVREVRGHRDDRAADLRAQSLYTTIVVHILLHNDRG